MFLLPLSLLGEGPGGRVRSLGVVLYLLIVRRVYPGRPEIKGRVFAQTLTPTLSQRERESMYPGALDSEDPDHCAC